MIPIALLREFLSYQFIASAEVSSMARCSSKTNELRYIDSIGCRAKSKLDLTISCAKDFQNLNSMVAWCIN